MMKSRLAFLILLIHCFVTQTFLSRVFAAEEVVVGSPIEVRRSPAKLSLLDAIALAQQRYPQLKVDTYQFEAAQANVEKAKTAYLPRADVLVEELRGTSNNIIGPLFPNAVVPSIGGGVRRANDFRGGWLSAAGTLLSWEPFDFGVRQAEVNIARAKSEQAQAHVSASLLDVESSTADAFLSAAAAEQLRRAAQAKMQRMKTFVETVQVLVQKQLRPKTDEYLALAELAKANDEVTEAEQMYDLSIATLAKYTGTDTSLELSTDRLIKPFATLERTFDNPLLKHPLVLEQQASVKVWQQRVHLIDRSYYPKFNLLGSVYGRGSGFHNDLTINQGQGFYPTKLNYAAGLMITMPLLDIFQLRAEHKIAAKTEAAERARLELTVLEIKTQDNRARALLRAAQKIAENAPIKVKAATEAARSVQVRYRLALASVNDVAQDEQLLTQSQVDFATAQLRIWRALLAISVANGDISQFTKSVASVISVSGKDE